MGSWRRQPYHAYLRDCPGGLKRRDVKQSLLYALLPSPSIRRCGFCLPPAGTKFMSQLEHHISAIRYSCHSTRQATRCSRRRREHTEMILVGHEYFGIIFAPLAPERHAALPEDGIFTSPAAGDKGWVIKRDSRELPFFFSFPSNNHRCFNLMVDGPHCVSPPLPHFLIDRAAPSQSNNLQVALPISASRRDALG